MVESLSPMHAVRQRRQSPHWGKGLNDLVPACLTHSQAHGAQKSSRRLLVGCLLDFRTVAARAVLLPSGAGLPPAVCFQRFEATISEGAFCDGKARSSAASLVAGRRAAARQREAKHAQRSGGAVECLQPPSSSILLRRGETRGARKWTLKPGW